MRIFHWWKTVGVKCYVPFQFQTPDGEVSLSHWEEVVKQDETLHIKVCHTLTKDHIHPHHYQTMNVEMASQVITKN